MELCRALLTEQVGRDLWMGLWALEPGTILWIDLVGMRDVVAPVGLDLWNLCTGGGGERTCWTSG